MPPTGGSDSEGLVVRLISRNARWHAGIRHRLQSIVQLLIRKGGAVLIELPVPIGSGIQRERVRDLRCTSEAAGRPGLPDAVTLNTVTLNMQTTMILSRSAQL